MIARGAGEADDGIAMDADEASGLSNAVALGEMMKHSSGLLVGHAAIEQRGALALREAGLAGVAIEQSDVVVLAVASADGEVSGAASPVGGTVGILAAEAREIIHNDGASRPAGWLKVQGLGFKLLDILRCPIALCSVVQGHHRFSSTRYDRWGKPPRACPAPTSGRTDHARCDAEPLDAGTD